VFKVFKNSFYKVFIQILTLISQCFSNKASEILDMPLLQSTNYRPPKWLFNSHLETIYPAIFRRIEIINPKRERIPTSDHDFLDLDWYRTGSSKLILISHGLEGNSSRPYMLGMAKLFLKNNFDVLTWTFRGCGEELNKNAIFYHSGATYDLEQVIRHAQRDYEEVYPIGFSLGGNLTLKYLGELGSDTQKIKKGVAISVPLHLASSSQKISTRENRLYSNRFLKTLKEKVVRKSRTHPAQIPLEKLKSVKTLADFDEYFTGPLHGFKDAQDYYQKNSALYFLDQIKVPTLVLNAQNDPFLTEKCFPVKMAKSLESVYFEFPKQGGHVGFASNSSEIPYYSEQRAVEFITSVL
jgi:predicted alpha/beta-fold hydrolase